MDCEERVRLIFVFSFSNCSIQTPFWVRITSLVYVVFEVKAIFPFLSSVLPSSR